MLRMLIGVRELEEAVVAAEVEGLVEELEKVEASRLIGSLEKLELGGNILRRYLKEARPEDYRGLRVAVVSLDRVRLKYRRLLVVTDIGARVEAGESIEAARRGIDRDIEHYTRLLRINSKTLELAKRS